MSVLAGLKALLLGGGDYLIQRSVRLRAAASAYFSRSAVATNTNQLWAYSIWIKRGAISSVQEIFSAASASNSFDAFYFNALDQLCFQESNVGSVTFQLTTNQLFRDPSAWYHLVLVYDSLNATASNRIKLYVNGVQVTSFSTATYPTLGNGGYISWTGSTTGNTIGKFAGLNTEYVDGYIAEVNYVTGQALAPTAFGENDSITGVWKPKKYAGTYGTNGFYLNFSDNSAATAAAIGKDSSGNGNNWTPNNISVTAGVTYDSMTDVPTLNSPTTGNYCTWSPVAGTNISTFLSGGNLNFLDASNSGAWRTTFSTMNVASGLWYFETTIPASLGSSAGNLMQFSRLNTTTSNPPPNTGSINYGIYWNQFGQLSDSTQTISIGTIAVNDVIMLAIDVTNGKLWVGKNGTWFSGNPATGTSPSVTWTPYEGAWSQSVFSNNAGGGGQTGSYTNFGQRPFSYSIPSGFKTLNTFNLPDATIPKGNKHFDVTLYTGNGSTQSIVNAGTFQPDFVWIKGRSQIVDHRLLDSIRGATKELYSDLTNAEATDANGLTSFNSNGFSLGTSTSYNNNTSTYASWQWNAGGNTVSNTSGSITSSVRANPTAGISVVTYTAPASGAYTVGHGLGVAPSLILMKDRSNNVAWIAYHKSVSTTTALYLVLNSTAALGSAAAIWGSALPTSTVFGNTVGVGISVNAATVAYCFAEVAGFSKFGSYTGNGSADGPFVYCGFRPRYVLIKRTDGVTDWVVLDTSRDTYNLAINYLVPDTSGAETSGASVQLDFVSNGFKIRGTWAGMNASGGTIIYAAFSENPFKNALAR